nr:uncharacterized protein LOC105338860 isoform X2 [Crassostrea gigas]
MSFYTKLCLLVLIYFFSSIIVLNTCNEIPLNLDKFEKKKLEGYKFPVYSTEFCPGNESEWNKRSSTLNCNKTNGYTCLPNENFTELLEFCYTAPFIWIQEGVCLYLKRKGSYVDAYSCSHFIDGCHNASYQSRRIFDYPACITIGNGCFLAEQSCKSSSNGRSGIDKDDWIWVLIVISIVVVVCSSSCMLYVYRKRKFSSCKRGNDIKNTSIELEELRILITDTENVKNDISSEPYKCIGANSLDDFEEKVSFTANVGTDKKGFSYEVMLESSSCKRGKDIECTLNETEERKSLIADTGNVKSDFSTESYKRCIGVKNQDDMKEKESFTANIGREKDISCEGRDVNVISFSYCSILGLGIRFFGSGRGFNFDFF